MSDYLDAKQDEQDRKEERPTRSVGILGSAPKSLRYAPFDNDRWELWGTSNNHVQLPRWDVWFELHSLEFLAQFGGREEHIEWMFEDHGPDRVIYCREELAHQIPNGVPYPLEVIREKFPAEYFTNSISWMLALAIYQQVDQIGLWGVDMSMKEEYRDQRPSCEYYIGLARGMGIPVHIPDQSDLLKARQLYGFHEPDGYQKSLDAREDEIQSQLNQINQQLENLKAKKHRWAGALDQMEWDQQNHMHSEVAEKLEAVG